MSEKRFSGWAVLVIGLLALGIAAAALAGGLFVGYWWGRSNAVAAMPYGSMMSRGEMQPFGPMMPYGQQMPRGDTQPYAPPSQQNPPGRSATQQPYLGVAYELVTPDLAAQHDLAVDHGAWVTQVIAGSPAADAGLQVGDVIVAVEGDQVDADHPLADLILQHAPGDQIRLQLNRGQRTLRITAELGTR